MGQAQTSGPGLFDNEIINQLNSQHDLQALNMQLEMIQNNEEAE